MLDERAWTREDCAELANRAQVSIDEAQHAILECVGRLVVDERDPGDGDYRRAIAAHRLLSAATSELDGLIEPSAAS
jgi:hypothetical protein